MSASFEAAPKLSKVIADRGGVSALITPPESCDHSMSPACWKKMVIIHCRKTYRRNSCDRYARARPAVANRYLALGE
jgi:hypothetical protein